MENRLTPSFVSSTPRRGARLRLLHLSASTSKSLGPSARTKHGLYREVSAERIRYCFIIRIHTYLLPALIEY